MPLSLLSGTILLLHFVTEPHQAASLQSIVDFMLLLPLALISNTGGSTSTLDYTP